MGDQHGLDIVKENPLKFWEQLVLNICHNSHTAVFQDSTNTFLAKGFTFDISQVPSNQTAAFQVRSICMMQCKFVSAIQCHYGSFKVPKLKLCHFLLLYRVRPLILSCFRRDSSSFGSLRLLQEHVIYRWHLDLYSSVCE